MNAIEIVPTAQGHIDGFHRALDIVARERRYLAFLEAPPIEATRTFVFDNIKRGSSSSWPYRRMARWSAGAM
ncbi:MAG: hypothetical protein QOD09_253 [Bradyrhizobium sp.]|jgi:hypothetical protein|nr:hypothetical protein [Bradyrhizobium sp.]